MSRYVFRRLNVAFVFATVAVTAMAQPYFFNTFAGPAGGSGSTDGAGSAARFFSPSGVATDSSGNVFIADSGNHTVRRITPQGVVTTFSGTAGSLGSTNGTGSAARFNQPAGVAVDGSGNLFVTDLANQTIRRITAAGIVTTFAGTAGQTGNTNATGSAARFNRPSAITIDGSGNLYVADRDNHTVRKITSAGVVTTLAGAAGVSGFIDGNGSGARFNKPDGVVVDSGGNVYVADSENHTIRKITPGGAVTTFAGSATLAGKVDGATGAARFNQPAGLAVDVGGNVVVADTQNDSIRMITPQGVVTTLAGGFRGSADGTATAAQFHQPGGVAADLSGNVFVADSSASTVRKIAPGAVVTTFAGLPAPWGITDASGSAARFHGQRGLTTDGSRNLYVADFTNNTIRKITTAGAVTTFAGSAGVAGSADGTVSVARFLHPADVAADSDGNLYVADQDNHTVRKITPLGFVTTIAGAAGQSGSTDGTRSSARFNRPSGVAVAGNGDIYVAQQYTHTIRKITPEGVVTTLGSAGVPGGTDGTGAAARFNGPVDLSIDSNGNVYVADTGNYTIRKITSSGDVTTFAGMAGVQGHVNATGSAARFVSPSGVAVDAAGNVYMADATPSTIRKITPAGLVSTVGGTAWLWGSANGTAETARFASPGRLAIDSAGVLYVSEDDQNRIRVGIASLSDYATIDLSTAPVNSPRQLGVGSATGTSFSWRLIRQPSTSAAEMSATNIANPTFTPDVPDRYEFELTVSNATQRSVTAVTLNATCPTFTVSPAVLPKAFPNVAYSQTISAAGAFSPYIFTVTSGTLPLGLTLSPAGSLNGPPASGGSYNFTVTATDRFACSASRIYTLIVNRAPNASSLLVEATEDTVRGITLAGTDPDGDSIVAYTVLSQPSKGTLSGTPPNLTYTPSPNANGPDSFTFTVSDGSATSASGTVSINIAPVNDAPVAMNDVLAIEEDSGTAVVPVLANDTTGPDAGETLAVTAVTQPVAGGTVTLSSGTVLFNPDSNFSGALSFTYTNSDGNGGTAIATVNVTVTAVNDAPAAPAQVVTVREGSSVAIVLTGNDPEGSPVTFAIAAPPVNGQLNCSGASCTYTPNVRFAGTDQFTFTASDGTATSQPSPVSITVTSVGFDPNGDMTVTVPDVFYLVNHLFAGGPSPFGSAGPIRSGDANGDGAVSISDVFYAVHYLFSGGPAPVP